MTISADYASKFIIDPINELGKICSTNNTLKTNVINTINNIKEEINYDVFFDCLIDFLENYTDKKKCYVYRSKPHAITITFTGKQMKWCEPFNDEDLANIAAALKDIKI